MGALRGLSAHDELYLWALLSIALSQPDPKPDLYATPYFCLKNLGQHGGGRQFQLFRDAISRIAGVRYENDRFYDPIRGEHRQVSFGFLNFSLPLSENSSRAWRFAWDPIFFEICQATGGALRFDLALYRELDPATRRLYLFLKKVLFRRDTTPMLNARHLAVDVLGFAPDLEAKYINRKLRQCIKALLDRDIIVLPNGISKIHELFQRESKDKTLLRLHEGSKLHANLSSRTPTITDSPLYDPLHAVGFDDRTIARLLSQYSATLLEQWSDITLAAHERNGPEFFTASPQAYFIDNIKAAAAKTRTPPDWWRDMRKQELLREKEQERSKREVLSATDDEAFDCYLEHEAREAFQNLMGKLTADLRASGQSHPEAQSNADRIARSQLRTAFRRDHPEHG